MPPHAGLVRGFAASWCFVIVHTATLDSAVLLPYRVAPLILPKLLTARSVGGALLLGWPMRTMLVSDVHFQRTTIDAFWHLRWKAMLARRTRPQS
uniref:Transmembrane protein n=1 Tax=Ascaris lumbricoides TaxID=6252 RepID=A0A0M3IAV7_ASCLU